MRRSSKRFSNFNLLIDWLTPKRLAAIIVIIGAIVGICLGVALGQRPDVKKTKAYKEGIIYIGIESGTPLAYKDESGNIVGFERDFAEEMVKRVYYDNIRIEIVETSDQRASYMLINGDIDVAFAMLTEGITKARGLLLTADYYRDSVVVVVNKGMFNSVKELKDKKVGVIDTDIFVDNVETMLTQAGAPISKDDFFMCTSYPDSINTLKKGGISALIAPKYDIINYVDDDLQILGSIGQTGYKAAVWTDYSDMLRLFTDEINNMNNDGTSAALKEKWGLDIN